MSARVRRLWIAACAFFWACIISLAADAQIGGPIMGGGSGGVFPGNIKVTGTICGVVSFAPCLDMGNTRAGTVTWSRIDTPATSRIQIGYDGTNSVVAMDSAGLISWGASAGSLTVDTSMARNAAGIIRNTTNQNAGTAFSVFNNNASGNSQAYYEAHNGTKSFVFGIKGTGNSGFNNQAANDGVIYGSNANLVFNIDGTGTAIKMGIGSSSTSGFQFTANGIQLNSGSSAQQFRMVQTTVPTITTNGGTGPACVGSDSAMRCTIGTAPPAAATFTVTFQGTWPTAAPSCNAMRGTTGTTPTVVGVVSGTTTVVVNLSANLVASEIYHIQCQGVA